MRLLHPNMIILYIAILGAIVAGFPGFIGFGIGGFILMLIITSTMHKVSGGILPRKFRDQIVTDFVVENNDLLTSVYPNESGYDRKLRIEKLLEEMAKRSVRASGSTDPAISMHPMNFLPIALEVAEEQGTEQLKELAFTFVEFLEHHPQCYGKTFRF